MKINYAFFYFTSTEPPYNRLDEDQGKQELPAQQGYPPQQEYPPQYGYSMVNTAENQQICLTPTSTVVTRVTQVQPDDHLALSIFVLICCCLPVGIVAVIKASEVCMARSHCKNDHGSTTSIVLLSCSKTYC
ncbi:hypothetical protein HOLleu_02739 [Holothuria leucospilota]|uniref:Uncharacterized protein n=1 Tax=Holothuria leucospilota TaxID=206669 RepID=A0A9Q1CS19_HOLLE|nr:hypothetical protein HOLleu_02739 [Holothuria leucospilota]